MSSEGTWLLPPGDGHLAEGYRAPLGNWVETGRMGLQIAWDRKTLRAPQAFNAMLKETATRFCKLFVWRIFCMAAYWISTGWPLRFQTEKSAPPEVPTHGQRPRRLRAQPYLKNPKCHQTTHHPAAAVHPGGVAAGRTASVAAPAPPARKPQHPSHQRSSPSGRKSPPFSARSLPPQPPVPAATVPFPATRRPVQTVRSGRNAQSVASARNAPSGLSERNVPPARSAHRASAPLRLSRSPRRVSM